MHIFINALSVVLSLGCKGVPLQILDAFIDVSFLLCLLRHRDFDSLSDLTEESKVKYIAQRWEELGLKDVQVTNHTALLSYPGPALSTIVDKIGNQCYLPSGARCGQPSTSTTEPFAFAAYSAAGSLVVSYSSIYSRDLYHAHDCTRNIRWVDNLELKTL